MGFGEEKGGSGLLVRDQPPTTRTPRNAPRPGDGQGGIRTLETTFAVYTLSKRARSTAPPPVQSERESTEIPACACIVGAVATTTKDNPDEYLDLTPEEQRKRFDLG